MRPEINVSKIPVGGGIAGLMNLLVYEPLDRGVALPAMG
jgi:hypothetical protein